MSSAARFNHSNNADVYMANASFVYSDENTRAVLALLDAQPGDVVLDVGCGTGVLTAKIGSVVADAAGAAARGRPPGRVVGIDASADMVGTAQRSFGAAAAGEVQTRADSAAAATLRFALCDAHNLTEWLASQALTGTFDKVFSNATLHWVKRDPAKAARGLAHALKPGGTLAVELGGHTNVIGVRSSLYTALMRRGKDPTSVDPWYFPTVRQYTRVLQQDAGLEVQEAVLVPRLTPLPKTKGLVGWLESFAGPFLNALSSPAEQAEVIDELQTQLRTDMYDADDDQWTAMYVRLRVCARRPLAQPS